jgi:hypothetical protein
MIAATSASSGWTAMGRAIIVVIVDDDPDYVITTFLDD